MAVNEKSIVEQSKAAYGQWKEQWRDHATQISRLAPHKSLNDFANVGIGKACLLVANGYSFEKNLETIKKYKDQVDILCCDKTLGSLLDHGIKPTYCMVCDANVDFEKYMEPWKDQLEDIVLFMNVCANPKWAFNGNWKDRYFFVNKDAIQSEVEFTKLSRCANQVPAATNVSNAMVVFLAQSDNTARRNFFGYDKMLLIGFDYSWTLDGSYYAFNKDGNGKAHYMRHVYCLNNAGKDAYTSGNLLFSAQWLEKYVKNFNLPVVQCTDEALLGTRYNGKLEEQMQYNYKPLDAEVVKNDLFRKAKLENEITLINKRLSNIGEDHFNSFIKSL